MKRKTMQKTLFFIMMIGFLSLLFTSCAPSVEGIELSGEPYGFFHGLLHGIIAPFAFIGNLFGGEYAVYVINNTGNWYDFGFLLGIGGFSFGFNIR